MLFLPLFRLFVPLSFLLFPSHFSSVPPIPFGQCVRPLRVEESHSLFETKHGHYFSNGSKARFSVHLPSSGFVTSDGYPNGYENQKCSLELVATPSSGLVVHLSFVDLDLEAPYSRSEQCLRDYIVVTIIDRDGREYTGDRICGDRRPKAIQTMQSRARILFIASSLSPPKWRGFRMKFEFVPESTILAPSSSYYDTDRRHLTECGGVNSPTEMSGEIRSPGFPYTFPRNVTCNWLLRVAPDHRINIRLLQIELSSAFECERASLQFFDGFRHDFEMDDSLGTFSFRHSQQSTDALFCGGSAYYREEGMKSFLSERNRVFVRFTTREGPTQKQLADYGAKRKAIGFRLIWTEVQSLVHTAADDPRALRTSLGEVAQQSFVTADQCAGFVCSGGEFCVDATENICVERMRLCINETLRCDGMANCAENDDSDETFCFVQKVLPLATFVPLLFLLSLLLSLFCFSYRILKCLRTKAEKNEWKRERRNGNDEKTEEKRERRKKDGREEEMGREKGGKCERKEAEKKRDGKSRRHNEIAAKPHGGRNAKGNSLRNFTDSKNTPRNGHANFATNEKGHWPSIGPNESQGIFRDSEVWTKRTFGGKICQCNGTACE
ncbi:hypothetical protein niasHT_022537 [Heterodera trifolii]|uniref:CUB domain-containing protein n=1 Tax=Heterodera trifolii TaxID=157864 RepID=A0ABD2JR26_9BILA